MRVKNNCLMECQEITPFYFSRQSPYSKHTIVSYMKMIIQVIFMNCSWSTVKKCWYVAQYCCKQRSSFYVCSRVASVFLQEASDRIGKRYKKAMYREFTDGTFKQLSARPPWLGYLGPVLRAEVGDVIVVHLKNFATRSYSIHPHGVFYEKDAEGTCL